MKRLIRGLTSEQYSQDTQGAASFLLLHPALSSSVQNTSNRGISSEIASHRLLNFVHYDSHTDAAQCFSYEPASAQYRVTQKPLAGKADRRCRWGLLPGTTFCPNSLLGCVYVRACSCMRLLTGPRLACSRFVRRTSMPCKMQRSRSKH